jgi:hypothetical protein
MSVISKHISSIFASVGVGDVPPQGDFVPVVATGTEYWLSGAHRGQEAKSQPAELEL